MMMMMMMIDDDDMMMIVGGRGSEFQRWSCRITILQSITGLISSYVVWLVSHYCSVISDLQDTRKSTLSVIFKCNFSVSNCPTIK